MTNHNDSIEKLKHLLRHRDLYTPMDLVKMGIYGGKSSVHDAMRKGELQYAQISKRRYVIFKDSIIENAKRIKELNP